MSPSFPMNSTEAAQNRRSFHSQWSKDLASSGFTQLSNVFLCYYSRLTPEPLTHGEAMFVVHLFQHKWDAKAPFPGYRSLSTMMGISEKSAKRYARSLEQKGFLKRETRAGRSSRFDLSPLIRSLEKINFQKLSPLTRPEDDIPF